MRSSLVGSKVGNMVGILYPISSAARVTPTLPKQDRPVREGTRVASIETGLAAAAAKLAQQVGANTQGMALLLILV